MFHQKNVYFILFLVYLSIGTIHTQLNKKESPKKRTEKRKDPQTVVVVREVKPVNGRYRDESEEVDDEFHEDMRSFHEGDVLDDVSKSGPERKREAQARSLGGLVINIDGLLSGAKFVPENVFGPKYKTHLIEEPCTPVGFPYICELREMIDRRYKCPVNIPYCQRIPCGGNPEFNTDQYKCLKQPGCCFDEVLYNYRRYYGQTVLPRVPVCHMAVRNQYFHRVARQFADRYRSWNPLLTSCLIKSHRNRIEKNLMECQTLDILEYFGYKAKHAGWNDILPRECGLIGGCWRPGFGCFYPPRMTHIQLRSSYEHPIYRPYSPFDLYGQPMCRPMDPYANSEDFLSSYHQCLASGCQLDPAMTPNVILYHLYNVSSQLPRHLVNSFKYEIMLGKVRPDNWKEQQKNFLKYGKIHPYAYTPRQGGPNAHANIPN
uniref:uncharacterized protein LOC120346439 n=1 Tax=Styela clava TaxID=7725 RepID=UPI00193AB840|nr:uncharacterized protein LOC120346439 [Styela clava]